MRSKQARWLLGLIIHCAPNYPIPIDLLHWALYRHLARAWSWRRVLRLKPKVDLGRVLARPVNLGLLKLRGAGSGLVIHPLIVGYIRRHLDDPDRWLPILAQTLNAAADDAISAGEDALLAALAPHLEIVAESAQEAGLVHAGVLWDELGVYHFKAGDLDEAREALDWGLAVSEESLGLKHPVVTGQLVDLGAVLLAQGNLERAEAVLERALAVGGREGAESAIRRVLPLLPKDHPRTEEVREQLEALVRAEADGGE